MVSPKLPIQQSPQMLENLSGIRHRPFHKAVVDFGLIARRSVAAHAERQVIPELSPPSTTRGFQFKYRPHVLDDVAGHESRGAIGLRGFLEVETVRGVAGEVGGEDLSGGVGVAFVGARGADGVVWAGSGGLQAWHRPLDVEEASGDIVDVGRRIREVGCDWGNVESRSLWGAIGVVVFWDKLRWEIVRYCGLGA